MEENRMEMKEETWMRAKVLEETPVEVIAVEEIVVETTKLKDVYD